MVLVSEVHKADLQTNIPCVVQLLKSLKILMFVYLNYSSLYARIYFYHEYFILATRWILMLNCKYILEMALMCSP